MREYIQVGGISGKHLYRECGLEEENYTGYLIFDRESLNRVRSEMIGSLTEERIIPQHKRVRKIMNLKVLRGLKVCIPGYADQIIYYPFGSAISPFG